MPRVDLNCDMGESFGRYPLGNDEALLGLVTSANIACGFHAGDPSVMRRTVRLAVDKGVAVGAHPGYRDLQGFGRRFIALSPQEAYDSIVYQVGALYGFVRAAGGVMRHVKPHGALYNAGATDRALADAIASAVGDVDPELVLFGLSGSELIAAGKDAGLALASEGFADRRYEQDGTLTPRSRPEALIEDADEATEQAVRAVRDGVVRSAQGTDVAVRVDTICIHGDGPHAYAFARMIRERLEAGGISVQAAATRDHLRPADPEQARRAREARYNRSP